MSLFAIGVGGQARGKVLEALLPSSMPCGLLQNGSDQPQRLGHLLVEPHQQQHCSGRAQTP